MQRAKLKLDTGDVQAARELLAKVPSDFNETQEIWETKFNAALYARVYDAAEKLIAATPDEWTDRVYIGNPPQTWFNGMLAHVCAATKGRHRRSSLPRASGRPPGATRKPGSGSITA